MDTRPRPNRRAVLLFLIAALLLLVLGPKIKPIAGILSPVYSPVTSVLSTASADIGTFVGSLIRAPSLDSKNRELQRENAMLQKDVADIPVYQRELHSLYHELHFSNLNPHLQLVRTSLLSQGVPGLDSTLEINAGSDQGVHVQNPVLDANGFLIGKVLSVTPGSATVGLLSQYGVNVPAMDARTGALGLVQERDGQILINDVEAGKVIRVGDWIVTSSIGNEYPVGQIIGRVTSLQGGSVQSLNAATISTSASLDSISDVQVVTNFPPKEPVHYGGPAKP